MSETFTPPVKEQSDYSSCHSVSFSLIGVWSEQQAAVCTSLHHGRWCFEQWLYLANGCMVVAQVHHVPDLIACLLTHPADEQQLFSSAWLSSYWSLSKAPRPRWRFTTISVSNTDCSLLRARCKVLALQAHAAAKYVSTSQHGQAPTWMSSCKHPGSDKLDAGWMAMRETQLRHSVTQMRGRGMTLDDRTLTSTGAVQQASIREVRAEKQICRT